MAATAAPTAALAKPGGSYQQCLESSTPDGDTVWVCVPIHSTRPLCDDCPDFAFALAEPDPTPWLAAAMDQFTESYQELAQQEVIGR